MLISPLAVNGADFVPPRLLLRSRPGDDNIFDANCTLFVAG